ncbi:uncharacterized protein LOC127852158 [Dreissena polymorpha]|uniref:PHD-type domain-containing protein n=1 Tax=Dreissena polymorpha TaxID=45954 RepID=A0A9D4CGJ9_DREPO|nr:uncharacterized protein LOC127852158 [Dreissena polymorpha]KAH3724834.1 hypothetical protein DPMN_050661 [Dreissena polymorpha]
MPAPPCLFCLRRVYQNSRAVTCDNCSRWHHIKCGNTWITDEQYDVAVAENRDLQFVCMRCRHNNTDENGDLMDEIVNSIPDSTNTTMESTATSAMSLLEEEMEVDHAFDITARKAEACVIRRIFVCGKERTKIW